MLRSFGCLGLCRGLREDSRIIVTDVIKKNGRHSVYLLVFIIDLDRHDGIHLFVNEILEATHDGFCDRVNFLTARECVIL